MIFCIETEIIFILKIFLALKIVVYINNQLGALTLTMESQFGFLNQVCM